MTFPLVCKCLLDRRTRRPGSCTIQVAEMNAVLPTEGRESRKPLLGVHSKRLKDLRARDKAAGGRKCLSSSRQSGSVLPGRAPNASGGKRIREDEPHARGMRTTDATKCNVDLQIRGNPDIVNSVVVDVVPCVSDRNFKSRVAVGSPFGQQVLQAAASLDQEADGLRPLTTRRGTC